MMVSSLGLLVVCLVALVVVSDDAEASHFRYGHYSWEEVDEDTVVFTIENAWRRSGYGCFNPATLNPWPCSTTDNLPGPGDMIHEKVGHTQLHTGDGRSIGGPNGGGLYYLVTSIDPANNWLMGLAIDPGNISSLQTRIHHTYDGPGTYLAYTDDCCRISAATPPNRHVNNPDVPYRVETLVSVGSGNAPPVSSLPPIVVCMQDALCSFPIPVADADGDAVRFRLSEPAESGGITQPGPPHAPNPATVSPDGTYSWDTSGATIGPEDLNTLYSTQVLLEDLDGAGNVKSKTALDFMIELVAPSGVPPDFDEPTPICNAEVPFEAGNAVSFDVRATDPDPDDLVTLNAAGLPAGATLTPKLPLQGNPVETRFSWTPDGDTPVALTFTATDAVGQQTLCSVVLTPLKGDLGARAFGLGFVSSNGTAGYLPHANLQDGDAAWQDHDLDFVRVTGARFDFGGEVHFPGDGTLLGHARAETFLGVVEVPGVLRAEGVHVTMESRVDADGARSVSEVRFARLAVGPLGLAIDPGGSRTIEVPGLATIHLHDDVDSGTNDHNAAGSVTALRIVLHAEDAPVKEILIGGAETQVGTLGGPLERYRDPWFLGGA